MIYYTAYIMVSSDEAYSLCRYVSMRFAIAENWFKPPIINLTKSVTQRFWCYTTSSQRLRHAMLL